MPEQFSWGQPIRLEKPVKSFALGKRHTIILFEDGSLRCQGCNLSGECTPPAGLKPALEVTAGEDFSAARLEDGSVVTWGTGVKGVPAGIRSISIKASDNDLLIVTSEGKVWSTDHGFLATRSEAVQLAAGDGVYYLDKQGKVFKAGSSQDEEPVFENALSISGTGDPWFMGALLKDGKVHIHNQGILGTYSGGDTKIAQFARSESSTHAILPDGSVCTWNMTSGMVKWPESKSPAVKIFGGNYNSIALFKDGTFRAFGNSDWGCLTFSPEIQPVTRVKCTRYGGCIYFCANGSAVVRTFTGGLSAGFSNILDMDLFDSPGDFSDFLELILTKKGTLYAGGDNTNWCCDIPHDSGDVVQVSCGNDFVIALRSNGTITAWGRNRDVVTAVLPSRGKFSAVAAATDFAVALTHEGKAVTFGLPNKRDPNFKKQPEGLPVITGIAAGDRHVVAVSDKGKVFAWGWDDQGDTNVPDNLPPAAAVAAGTEHSAALLKDGTLGVWGKHGPLPELPPLQSICSAGGAIAAVTREGSAVFFDVFYGKGDSRDFTPRGIFKTHPVTYK
ncbi:MAG TPA: hypothetical protein VHM91_04020 [Verrucomicrobiales bacterium]|nr:hypothetical protein [Verrucomicrobiales bacterium]